MDITLPKLPKNLDATSLSTSKAVSLNLKVDQQLTAKIIKYNTIFQVLSLKLAQSTQPIQVQSNLAVKTIQGQIIQLLVTKAEPNAEFKVLPNAVEIKSLNLSPALQLAKPLLLNELVLKQLPSPTINQIKETLPVVVTAKIIAIQGDKIQLKLDLPTNNSPVTSSDLKQTPLKIMDKPSIVSDAKTFNNSAIITLKKDDLISTQKDISLLRLESQPYKIGQKIQLINLNKENNIPKFKEIKSTPEKLNIGQVINATVLETKNNKIQLSLHLKNSPHSVSNSSTITLNTNQLSNSSLPINPLTENKDLSLDISTLKQGQLVKFQVTKTGNQPEFALIKNTPFADTKKTISETITQTLPIHAPSSELINQIVKNLSTINENESIPDNLKRIARNILKSIPHVQSEKINPKQLKQFVLNSGLFLETKLNLSHEKDDLNLQKDFKNQLLQLNHALKQEVEVKNQQKLLSPEVELLKEMQQKTEGSLAKIILNQLSSLPKEEGIKQAWVVDLPFLNKGFSESVKIEVNREQQENEENKQENWAVTITITPPELGTIYCKVSCFDKTINTRFWSDTEAVVSKISKNLDYLKTQFEKIGIETGHMSAHMGTPSIIVPQNTSNQNLFDKEA